MRVVKILVVVLVAALSGCYQSSSSSGDAANDHHEVIHDQIRANRYESAAASVQTGTKAQPLRARVISKKPRKHAGPIDLCGICNIEGDIFMLQLRGHIYIA
jgi:hypothetical protein